MDDLEEIKKRVELVDFVSQYLTLKKAGSNYKAPCPFHQERTPSFMVSPEKQIFKCFGCGESGDIFGFLMKMEGLNFPEALQVLADRAGVILAKSKSKKEFQQEKDLKSRIYKINKISSQVYQKILLEHASAKQARDYLKKRQIKDQSIKDFMIGYAPQKAVLQEFLQKRGFTNREINQAGNPERFKNRLIFPITDQMGNPVGFTGRVLDSDPPAGGPKYLNTSETNIFHKSRLVYALSQAKQAIKEKQSAIIAEGQMDVIASHQVGIKNVVASSGTSLTDDHLQILSRYCQTVIFAFDEDLAGYNAAKKAIFMAIAKGLNVKMILMPPGFKDIGELVEKDAKLWQEISQKPVSVLDWLINKTFAKYSSQLTGAEKKEIAKEILPYLAIIPDQIEQDHYIRVLAKKLATGENIIIDALSRIKTSTKLSDKNKSIAGKKISTEENLLGLLLTFPQLMEKAAVKLDYQDFLDEDIKQVYKLIQSCYTVNICPDQSHNSDQQKNCDITKNIHQCLSKKLPADLGNKIKSLTLEIAVLFADYASEDLEKELQANIRLVLQNKKDRLKEKFAQAIKEAEAKGDREKVKTILAEFQNVLK